MKVGQATFWCGTVFGLTLGLAAGHVTLWRQGSSDTSDFAAFDGDHQPRPFGLSGAPTDGIGPVPTPAELGLESVIGDEFGHTHFPTMIRTAEVGAQPTLTQAEAVSAEPSGHVEALETAEPSALQPAPNASPIDRSTAVRDEITRRVIQSELPDATTQEIDIWFDALGGLSADDVRNILRIRKNMGAGALPMLSSQPNFAAAPSENADSASLPPQAEPTERRLGDEPQHPHDADVNDDAGLTDHTMLPALFGARQILLSNIANSKTVGFKRLEPLYEDRTAQEANQVHLGVNLIGSVTDYRPGRLQPTSSPLDVAIDGAGFFAVQIGDERLFTRVGHFALDSQRRLVLTGLHAVSILQPEVIIDADIEEITIGSDGKVIGTPAAGLDEADTRELAQLELTLFVNPAGLTRAGGGLYRETPTSGRPHAAAPGTGRRGTVEQFHLEGSNVDLDLEMETLESIDDLIETIADE